MARVLLVDDVYTARSITERILRHVGRYEVQSVSSSEEAIAAAVAAPPDLVLTDITMPGMDGMALLHELRANQIGCPVVAYTARPEQVPGEFVAQGFSAYVLKDGNLTDLLAAVRTLLHES